MRRIGIGIAVLLGLGLLIIAGSVALIESGEVVVLHTRDGDDQTHAARIWIVDYKGEQWIAPGNRSNGWFQRLTKDPKIELVRSGERNCFIANIVEGPASIPALEQFLEKYSAVMRATTILNFIIAPGDDQSPPVAVRLGPC